MTSKAVAGSFKPQATHDAGRRRTLGAVFGIAPTIAASVAAMTFTLMAPPADAERRGDLQTSAFEAARASTSVPAARPKLKFAEAPAQANAPPQIDSHPSLPEEAPHMVPALQPPPASAQAAPKLDPSQPSLPEEAPNIVPVMPEGPGAAPTQVPAE